MRPQGNVFRISPLPVKPEMMLYILPSIPNLLSSFFFRYSLVNWFKTCCVTSYCWSKDVVWLSLHVLFVTRCYIFKCLSYWYARSQFQLLSKMAVNPCVHNPILKRLSEELFYRLFTTKWCKSSSKSLHI